MASPRARRWLIALAVFFVTAVLLFFAAYVACTPDFDVDERAEYRIELLEETGELSDAVLVAHAVAIEAAALTRDGLDWQARGAIQGVDFAVGTWTLTGAPPKQLAAKLESMAKRLARLRNAKPASREFAVGRDGHPYPHLLFPAVVAQARIALAESGAPAGLDVLTDGLQLTRLLGTGDAHIVRSAWHGTEQIYEELVRFVTYRDDVDGDRLREVLTRFPQELSIAEVDLAARRAAVERIETIEYRLGSGRLSDEYAIPFLGPRLFEKSYSVFLQDARDFLELPRGDWRQLADESRKFLDGRSKVRELFAAGYRIEQLCMLALGGAEMIARQRGTRWVIALEIERRESGRYPKSLADVAHHLGVTDPAEPSVWDPLANAPFGYAVREKGYRLWGVGYDLKDDGGTRRTDLRIDPFDD